MIIILKLVKGSRLYKEPCDKLYTLLLSCSWSIAKLCPTLFDPINCSLSNSSVHGISQARILELAAIAFFRGSSQPRDWTLTSCIGSWVLYHWATREANLILRDIRSFKDKEFCRKVIPIPYKMLLEDFIDVEMLAGWVGVCLVSSRWYLGQREQ